MRTNSAYLHFRLNCETSFSSICLLSTYLSRNSRCLPTHPQPLLGPMKQQLLKKSSSTPPLRPRAARCTAKLHSFFIPTTPYCTSMRRLTPSSEDPDLRYIDLIRHSCDSSQFPVERQDICASLTFGCICAPNLIHQILGILDFWPNVKVSRYTWQATLSSPSGCALGSGRFRVAEIRSRVLGLFSRALPPCEVSWVRTHSDSYWGCRTYLASSEKHLRC